jgi:ATPase family associated with various cellular activities (AAA)/Ankyrin repeats (many copies)/Ankyrin repeats (3 copies)
MTCVTEGRPDSDIQQNWVTAAVIPCEYSAFMTNVAQIRFAPAVASMRDYLEPHLPWLERVVGCKYAEALTFEIDVPIGRIVINELLEGVPLDDQTEVSPGLRAEVDRWELGSGVSPQIQLSLSRKRGTNIVEREPAWNAVWRDCPIAVWLKGERTAFVAVKVPYVSFQQGLFSKSKSWLIVNRASPTSVLNRLLSLFQSQPKKVSVWGGGQLSFTPNYDWDSVVLDPSVVRLVRNDFESFFRRERWFREHGLPFRRGYLFYGPPGNGKTTVIKVMASHPAITPLTFDFGSEIMNNESLSGFLEEAARNAPSLLIFEDLDRAFVVNDDCDQRPRITLQHFLNCIDGVGTQDGLIVVATANNPSMLDAAILKRPGRFDRVIPFRPPDNDLRAGYLHLLTRGRLTLQELRAAVLESDGFSFAQLRESYIIAGQLAFGFREHPRDTVIRMLVDSRCRAEPLYRTKFDMRKFKAAFARWQRYTGLPSAELAKSISSYRPPAPMFGDVLEPTILHTAAECNKELVHWLLEMGADVNLRDKRGWSPLDAAVYFCQKDIVSLLMAHGASPTAETFYHTSRSNRHCTTDGRRYPTEEEIVEMLLRSSGIHEAARWGCYKRVKTLLEDNPDLVFSKDEEGRTPLHHAMSADAGFEDVIELLMTSGADANARDANGSVPTPHWSGASDALNREIITRWLRKQGATDEEGALITTAIAEGTNISYSVVAGVLKKFTDGSRLRFAKVDGDRWYVKS